MSAFLGCLLVLLTAEPGDNARLLEGLPIRERNVPRQRGVELVHGVEVDRRVFLVVHVQWHLPAVEENAGQGGRYRALEGRDGQSGDLLGSCLWTLQTVLDHVGLEETSLQVYVVVGERLKLGCQDFLRGFRAGVDVVAAVRDNLRLHDRDKSLRLANQSIL